MHRIRPSFSPLATLLCDVAQSVRESCISKAIAKLAEMRVVYKLGRSYKTCTKVATILNEKKGESMNNVENLKELRKKAGLTQMQLAAKLGVSLMSIRIWESGAGKPNEENFKKLVKLFNLFKLFEVQPF